jgi:hypothetical protein
MFHAVSGPPNIQHAMVDAMIAKAHRYEQGTEGGLELRP